MTNPPPPNLYKKWAIFTLFVIYFLVLVGGIVRATGSGMGCPDWPRCFGNWIPPTDISQLPADYQTRYNSHGYGIETFNVYKTWTEYLNRLLGALTGIFLSITTLTAFPLRRTHPQTFYLTVAALITTGFQGWLGSKVVSTNLSVGMITIHMLVALIITVLLLRAIALLYLPTLIPTIFIPKSLKTITLVLFTLSIIQVLIGTQVREEIDKIAIQLTENQRNSWVDNLEISYLLHRAVAYLLLALTTYYFLQLHKLNLNKTSILYKITLTFTTITLFSAFTGISMALFGIPPMLQPVHLLFGVLITNLHYLNLLALFSNTK